MKRKNTQKKRYRIYVHSKGFDLKKTFLYMFRQNQYQFSETTKQYLNTRFPNWFFISILKLNTDKKTYSYHSRIYRNNL
jgi:hypothetical protein